MAEVVAVVGAVSASVQIAEQLVRATLGIIDVIKSVRHAPSSIRKQIHHVEQLLGISKLIIQNPALQIDSVASVLQSCLTELNELQNLLQRSKIDPNTKDVETFHRALIAFFNRKDVGARFQALERSKSSLMLCILEIDSSKLASIDGKIDSVRDELVSLSSVVAEGNQNLQTILDSNAAVLGNLQTVGSVQVETTDNMRNVSSEIPTMSAILANIQNNLLPALMQQLKMNETTQTSSKQNDDQSGAIFDVPNRRVRSFFGRVDVVETLDKALTGSNDHKIAVLQAMGGQGKSSVALEYCHLRRNDPFISTFWVSATTRGATEGSFEHIHSLINSTKEGQTFARATKISQVIQYLSSLAHPWLLVFDNYDDPDGFPAIQDFFPESNSGAILVTSRHAATEDLTLGSNGAFIKLSGLDEIAAVKLLKHHCGVSDLERDVDNATAIVNRLGHHPLAIIQAGSYIRKRRLDLGSFLDHYNRRKRQVLKFTSQITQYSRKLGDAETETSLNVFTTWELSFDQIQTHYQAQLATTLLTLVAFFNCSNVSESFFSEYFRQEDRETFPTIAWIDQFKDSQNAWNSDSFSDLAIFLNDLSLLQLFQVKEGNAMHISMHPLVKDWIRLRTDPLACRQYSYQAMLIMSNYVTGYWDAKNHIYDTTADIRQALLLQIPSQMENYEEFVCQEEPSHIDHLDHFPLLFQAFNAFQVFLETCGDYYLEEKFLEHIIKEEEVHAEDELDLIDSRMRLSKCYQSQGRFKESDAILQKLVELEGLAENTEDGEFYIDVLGAKQQLAKNYFHMGKLDEAEKLMLQVKQQLEIILGEEHYEIIIAKGDLALIYSKQTRYEEAETMTLQVISDITEHFHKEHPSIALAKANLGLIYLGLHRFKEAEAICQDVLDVQTRTQGAEHPDTLSVAKDLALSQWAQGRSHEAEKLLTYVVEKCQRIYGELHHDTLRYKRVLACVLSTLDRHVEALRLAEEAHKGFCFLWGPDQMDAMYAKSFIDDCEAIVQQKLLQADSRPGENTGVEIAEKKHSEGENMPKLDIVADILKRMTETASIQHSKT